MLHLKNGLTAKDLEGYTVIVPSFSIVNAAQLAIDVLIASKKMEYAGQITDHAIVPIFGHTAFKHNPAERASACELYVDKRTKLLAIQFRTIMVMEYAVLFHKKLAEMFKEWNVAKIIVISSGVQYEHEGFQLQYEASESFKNKYASNLDAVKWKEYSKSELLGIGHEKLLLKVFDKYDLPAMVLYSLVSFPTEAVEKKILFNQVTELVNNFLKSGDDFNITLPIGWNSLVENGAGEMMY